mmetsp:Transcript_69181/g.150539  ORF Transcript_69181/g.150539 Transcript_69181/m.150539 type:complete len:205 (-) Transcript_69181:204-818(-)
MHRRLSTMVVAMRGTSIVRTRCSASKRRSQLSLAEAPWLALGLHGDVRRPVPPGRMRKCGRAGPPRCLWSVLDHFVVSVSVSIFRRCRHSPRGQCKIHSSMQPPCPRLRRQDLACDLNHSLEIWVRLCDASLSTRTLHQLPIQNRHLKVPLQVALTTTTRPVFPARQQDSVHLDGLHPLQSRLQRATLAMALKVEVAASCYWQT